MAVPVFKIPLSKPERGIQCFGMTGIDRKVFWRAGMDRARALGNPGWECLGVPGRSVRVAWPGVLGRHWRER